MNFGNLHHVPQDEIYFAHEHGRKRPSANLNTPAYSITIAPDDKHPDNIEETYVAAYNHYNDRLPASNDVSTVRQRGVPNKRVPMIKQEVQEGIGSEPCRAELPRKRQRALVRLAYLWLVLAVVSLVAGLVVFQFASLWYGRLERAVKAWK